MLRLPAGWLLPDRGKLNVPEVLIGESQQLVVEPILICTNLRRCVGFFLPDALPTRLHKIRFCILLLQDCLSFIELFPKIAGNLQLVAFRAKLLRLIGSFLIGTSLE